MTREERIKRLEASIAFWDRLIPIEMLKAEKQTHFSVELREDMRIALAALRGPQPDPDTGLVRCGCGGKAGFHYSVMMRDNDCYVECGVCGEHSKVALSEDKARDAWNRAMGWREKE